MPGSPLIDAAALSTRLAREPQLVVLDAGFDLADPSAGERAYGAGHIPGARYVHLDRDLSGAKTGRNGRHPLPAREDFAVTTGRLGIAPGVPVVVYDRQGAMFAARAWWLLRWLGHAEVQVLDGGWAAWLAAGGAVSTVTPHEAGRPPYPAGVAAMPTLDADALLHALDRLRVIDARAPERYRGEVEPLDAQAGHIPGALNRPFAANLDADGRFKAASALRAEWQPLLGDAPPTTIHQCGSGVTACHNLLALELAGFGPAVLYPGSWSEWSSDPARPVARGA